MLDHIDKAKAALEYASSFHVRDAKDMALLAIANALVAIAEGRGELRAENAKLRELEGHIAESESIIDTLDAVVEGYIAQKKRIAELEAENRRQSADLYATAGANDKLEALVLDMYCQLLNAYDAKELDGFAERMRELGIEAGE